MTTEEIHQLVDSWQAASYRRSRLIRRYHHHRDHDGYNAPDTSRYRTFIRETDQEIRSLAEQIQQAVHALPASNAS